MEKDDIFKILDELWNKSRESFTLDQFKEVLSQWNHIQDSSVTSGSNVIEIYTDGGCRTAQTEGRGLGGWGVYSPTPGLEFKLCGIAEDTTNNIMELSAVKMALIQLFTPEVATGRWDTIRLFVDSSYTINTLSSWVWNWLKNGEIMTKKNSKLIREIADLIKLFKINEFSIQFVKVKGHVDPGNIIADGLVNQAMDENLTIAPDITMNTIAKTLLSYIYPEASIYTSNDKIIIMDVGWSNNPKFMYYTSLTQKVAALGYDIEMCGWMDPESNGLTKIE